MKPRPSLHWLSRHRTDQRGDRPGIFSRVPAPGPIGKLRDVAQRCRRGEPLPDELAHWLAASLDEFLQRRSENLAEAFRLQNGKGGIPWWRSESIRERDVALREMAERFFADLRPSVQAQRIDIASRRFAASRWREDRDKDEMPAHYRGKLKEYLWRAFASRAVMPLSERQLRSILRK